MNRSNVGNVITNGAQILSVGATTAGGVIRNLGKADSALNNLTSEQKNDYFKMKANKMIDETNAYNSSSNNSDIDNLMQNNSEQAENIKTKIKNDTDFIKEWKKGLSEENPIDDVINKFKKGE